MLRRAKDFFVTTLGVQLRHAVLIALPAVVWLGPVQAPTRASPGSSSPGSEPLERTWQLGPLQVDLRMSDRSPWVSDLVAVRLEVRAPAGMELRLPDLSGLPKDFRTSEVRRLGPRVDSDGNQVWELEFKLDALLPGSYELPGLELAYRDSPEAEWIEVATEALPLEFRSLLGDDPEAAQPKPNPGPAPWPGGGLANIVLIILILSLIIVIAGWTVFALRRRAGRRRPLPQVSAYRKAMHALDRLDRSGWLEKMELERFYIELSGIVRHYVEDRFRLRAPEQTTEEFLEELARKPVLDPDQRVALARFLEQADLVKFARMRPSATEGRAALQAAREFVEATRDESVLVAVENR